MNLIRDIVARAVAYAITLVLVALPGVYLLYVSGYPAHGIIDLASLLESMDLAMRRGDIAWSGAVGALWVMGTPFLALVLSLPARRIIAEALRKIRATAPSVDFRVPLDQSGTTRADLRMTKSAAMRPFEEALRRGRPKDFARAILAWYAAWTSMRDILETARLAYDAKVILERTASSWNELDGHASPERMNEAREAMRIAIGVATVTPEPAARPAPISPDDALGPVDDDYYANLTDEDPFEADNPFDDDPETASSGVKRDAALDSETSGGSEEHEGEIALEPIALEEKAEIRDSHQRGGQDGEAVSRNIWAMVEDTNDIDEKPNAAIVEPSDARETPALKATPVSSGDSGRGLASDDRPELEAVTVKRHLLLRDMATPSLTN